MNKNYCNSLFSYSRLNTLEVNIGGVPIGGDNPIRIQSMTTTDTMDTQATIEQTLRMVRSGAEYVRITAPSLKEARNLEEIKKGLRKLGCSVPLVADIHYTPNAAELAARIVEKVRVNPGNYADKKKFEQIEYSDQEYERELDRIYSRFSPLVKICKEYGTAMRIGTNHGSLSDRIMSRYGDTPLGMAESALEFLRICEDHNFQNIVISMKASNPQVMVQAYRLLVQKLSASGTIYPLHLGVTEAGEGEDGRIKSALGISTLLMDGIGDTVRVSLTEEPEYESPVAQFLVDMFTQAGKSFPNPNKLIELPNPIDPFKFERRETKGTQNIGAYQVPVVLANYEDASLSTDVLKEIGYSYTATTDKYNIADMAADFVYLGKKSLVIDLPGTLKPVMNYAEWRLKRDKESQYPYFSSPNEFLSAADIHSELNFVEVTEQYVDLLIHQIEKFRDVTLVIRAEGVQAVWKWRRVLTKLINSGCKNPFVLRTAVPKTFDFYQERSLDDTFKLSEISKKQLYLASLFSTFCVDGLVDGIWVDESDTVTHTTSFGILQLSRLRITKTEYISCPSCGRTLFDLQETTARIRKRTEHLKGVKIGIMGCIVNGPGEMADADYGYVGVGVDKIALYRGQEVVERGVKTERAVDKLIDLIKADGNWVEPATTTAS